MFSPAHDISREFKVRTRGRYLAAGSSPNLALAICLALRPNALSTPVAIITALAERLTTSPQNNQHAH